MSPRRNNFTATRRATRLRCRNAPPRHGTMPRNALDEPRPDERFAGMKGLASKSRLSPTAAKRWGKKLAGDVAAVMARHPEADAEDVRLTMTSLQSPPLERLDRSSRRGRGFAAGREGRCQGQEIISQSVPQLLLPSCIVRVLSNHGYDHTHGHNRGSRQAEKAKGGQRELFRDALAGIAGPGQHLRRSAGKIERQGSATDGCRTAQGASKRQRQAFPSQFPSCWLTPPF